MKWLCPMMTLASAGRGIGTSVSSMGIPPGLAYCRFYAELNDFLPPADRQRLLARRLESAGSVKDFFEGFGVPHPEVALILVDARPIGFGHQVLPGDRVSVFPRFR